MTLVTLDPATHRYSDEEGNSYRSTSSLINQYKEEFDSDRIAARVAAYRGCTPEEVKQEWSKAAPHGTRVHSCIEEWFLSFGEKKEGVHFNWVGTLEAILSRGKCYNEVIVFSRECLCAGTADLLVELPDGNFAIYDWKTNATIRQRSYRGKRMKAPLAHLEDCNFVHYSLQLSIYSELSGRNVTERYLVHIPREDPTGYIEVIPCLDLSKEAKLLLNIERKKNQ